MNNILENEKEQIYKCSKCGLCQKFCPVYNATKNEFFLPRGRYVILNTYIKNNQKLSTDFIKSLDTCLTCGQCRKNCPSDINYGNIITQIKKKYKFLNFSKKYKTILILNKIASTIYKFFPLKSIFLNSWLDKLYNIKIKRTKRKESQTKGNIVYFQGCVNKYINPSDKNASLNLIEKLGYKIIQINSNCCGFPFLCDRDEINFNNNAKKIITSLPTNFEYIVCSCSSCYETLQSIKEIKDKLITIEELLKINDIKIKTNESFTQYDKEFSLMKNLFMLKQPKIAKEIAKTFDFSNKNITTSCQLTKWSLLKHNIQSYSTAETISFLEKKE